MKKVLLFFAVMFAFVSCTAQLTEKVVETYPNGKTLKTQYFDKNNVCVKEVEYYESGQVKMEGAMKGEKREGEWKAYFLDGRLQSIGTFVDGLRTGAATVWQENGNLLQEGFYKEGKHVGKWKFYDEQGNLLKEVDYGE
ncbi:MAG: toxin-antitoxin system YwqK family antitoxin [Bacteroidales bacterium]|nr:toxin-antitoxin system YwqK family antitoxin [Bacteroidales bacterium]